MFKSNDGYLQTILYIATTFVSGLVWMRLMWLIQNVNVAYITKRYGENKNDFVFSLVLIAALLTSLTAVACISYIFIQVYGKNFVFE